MKITHTHTQIYLYITVNLVFKKTVNTQKSLTFSLVHISWCSFLPLLSVG